MTVSVFPLDVLRWSSEVCVFLDDISFVQDCQECEELPVRHNEDSLNKCLTRIELYAFVFVCVCVQDTFFVHNTGRASSDCCGFPDL